MTTPIPDLTPNEIDAVARSLRWAAYAGDRDLCEAAAHLMWKQPKAIHLQVWRQLNPIEQAEVRRMTPPKDEDQAA